MKTLPLFTIAAGLLSICVDATTLQKRADGPARVLGLPIQRKVVSDPVTRDRLRRRGTVNLSLDNEETLYFANVSLGTPGQPLRLHIDTGSSDLWVNTPQSTFCKGKNNPCDESGTYTANISTSYSYISSGFNISYVDGSGAAGDYVSDTLSIGGATLAGQQFGIGYQSTSANGILGVGYQLNEVQVNRLGRRAYENVPAKLVAGGLITSNAYSLYLNDLDSSTGNILFGGIDTEQFEGTLAKLPINPRNGFFTEFLITLTSLSLGGTAIASNQRVSVLLDSGSSLTYLPNSMASAIYQSVGAQYQSSQGAAFVPCSLAQDKSTLDYTFSSPTIKVSMSELVIDIPNSNGQPITFSDGTRACIFGIAPADSGTSVLGDTFLRSAYVVYDLANNEISLAQSTFNATTTNILEIGTGANAVPSATAVQNPATVTGSSGNSIGGSVIPTSFAAAAPVKTVLPLGAAAAAGAAMLFAAI